MIFLQLCHAEGGEKVCYAQACNKDIFLSLEWIQTFQKLDLRPILAVTQLEMLRNSQHLYYYKTVNAKENVKMLKLKQVFCSFLCSRTRYDNFELILVSPFLPVEHRS